MTELVRTYKLTDSGAWGWVTEEAEGGGGSLPSWWTVDSTPGSESVEFAGAVVVSPSASDAVPLVLASPAGQSADLIIASVNGSPQFNVSAGGQTNTKVLNLSGDTEGIGAEATIVAGLPGGDTTTPIQRLYDEDFNNIVHEVGPTGAVTISPSDAAAALTASRDGDDLIVDVTGFAALGQVGLSLIGNAGSRTLDLVGPDDTGVWITDPLGANGSGNGLYWVANGVDGEQRFQVLVGPSGQAALEAGVAGGARALAFFGGTLAAKPTGVAATGPGVHAALVTLGLIAA